MKRVPDNLLQTSIRSDEHELIKCLESNYVEGQNLKNDKTSDKAYQQREQRNSFASSKQNFTNSFLNKQAGNLTSRNMANVPNEDLIP